VYSRPWHHQRLVVQLAPGLWFIHDRCRPKIPADVRFHVGGVARIAAGSASVELAAGESLTLQSLSGHQPVAGFHDHSAKERKAGQWTDDTWEVVFPCGSDDSSVLISVGATATAKREGNQWNIQYGTHLLHVSLSADHLQVAGPDHEARIPVWLDPPLRSVAPQ
jgi:hypothetical protein